MPPHRLAVVFGPVVVLLGLVRGQEPPPYRFDLGAVATGDDVHVVDPTDAGAPVLELRAGAAFDVPDAARAPFASRRFLVADVLYSGRAAGTVRIEFFDAPSGDRPRIGAKLGLLPELPTRLVLPLDMLDGQTVFAPRRPRQLKGIVQGRRLDPEAIARVRFRLAEGEDGGAALRLTQLGLWSAEPAPLPAREAPVVDAIGQWTARDWPGKTGDIAAMRDRLRALHRDVTAGVEAGGPDRSRYGGFTAVRFEPTGWFRVEHDGERHWLVDPDGCAFFSVGIDCVGLPTSGPVAGMRDLFAWLPDGPELAPARSEFRGNEHVSFGTANLIRAFGEDWRRAWAELTAGLLRRYRFNTIGNWSDRDFIAGAELPWVLPLGGFPSTAVKVFRDFPDVFADEYAERSRRFAAQMESYARDRFLIGYFLRNEPNWGFGRHNVAAEMLATAAPSATRRALVAWLRERYATAADLAAAWEVEVGSFDALLDRAWPDIEERSRRAADDLFAFSEVMVDRYLRLPSEALREVAPNHLNLGIRYAWISSELCYVAAEELFDVFSLNAYVERPDAEQIAEITRRTGLPVMIGEFHHGATDRGLPATGIRGVLSQAERGRAYRYYVEHGAALPSLVGVHYFQWNDQPVTGRFDGENYNIGFVDVCLRPYEDFVGEVAATNAGLLEVLTGAREPTGRRARAVRPTFF